MTTHPATDHRLPQITLRAAEYGPVCISTAEGKLFFNSALCAERVMEALLKQQDLYQRTRLLPRQP